MLALRKAFLPKVFRFSRRIATSGRLASDELVTHRDTPDNNICTPFEFTEANLTRLKAILRMYPKGCERSALSAAVDIVQRQVGFVPITGMHKVAELLNIPRMRVYEWVTFYTMSKRRFRGKFHVKICKTTPCMLRGSDIIMQAVEEACMCPVGGVSCDGMFGVDLVECQGACANAPVVVVDDDYYEDMTVSDVQTIIRTLRVGGIPRCGPQVTQAYDTTTFTLFQPNMLHGYITRERDEQHDDVGLCLSRGSRVSEESTRRSYIIIPWFSPNMYGDTSGRYIDCIRNLTYKGTKLLLFPYFFRSGRHAAEPICGLTSLISPPPPPGFMLQSGLMCK